VSLNADGTGSVTTVASMTGSTVTIVGARPYERIADYSTGGDFFADTVNSEGDSYMILLQQLRETITRTLKLPATTTLVGDALFPEPEASKVIAWNSSANGLQNFSLLSSGLLAVSAFIETLLDDSDAAGARATIGADLSSNVSFIQSGTGAMEETVRAALRRLIFLGQFDTSGNYDTAKMLLTGTVALPFTEFIKPGVGLPHIKLIGTATRYATLRAGSDGLDDGDFYITQTGSTVWMQSYTDTYRLTLDLVPKGVVTTAPANIELFGTDFNADSTNYERLRIHSMGTSETAHEITSEKGGTGTVRPIHIFLGEVADGIYLDGANNGVGTKTPRRKLDVLDSGGVQFRLSQADNSKYVDFSVDSTGNIEIKPNGTTKVTINADGTVKIASLAGAGSRAVVADANGVLSAP